MFSMTVALLPLFLALARAANDWSTPCLDGTCTYHDTESGAVLKITGSPDSISDITEASGWVIASCDPNATTQTIRAICQKDDTSNNCSHLFTNGPRGTVVRLPEHCSSAAFAVVMSAEASQDQHIPQDLPSRVQGNQATVYDLRVTTQFDQVQTTKSGPVDFTLSSMTSQTFDENRLVERFVFKPSHEFGPFPFDESVNLYHQDFQCDTKNAHGVDAQLGVKGQTKVSLGIFVNGSVIPPKIHDFHGVIGLNGAMKAKLDLEVAADVTVQDTGLSNIVNLTLKPVEAAGILFVTPQITIDASIAADVSGVIRVNTVTDITADNVHFYVGGNKASDMHGLTIGDPQITLGSISDGSLTGFVDARVIIRGGISVKLPGGVSQNVPSVMADNWIRTIVDIKHQGEVDSTHQTAPSPAPTHLPRSIAGRVAIRDNTTTVVATTLSDRYCVDVKIQAVQNEKPIGFWTDMFNKCVDIDSNINREGPNSIQLGPGQNVEPKLNPLCDIPIRVVTFPKQG